MSVQLGLILVPLLLVMLHAAMHAMYAHTHLYGIFVYSCLAMPVGFSVRFSSSANLLGFVEVLVLVYTCARACVIIVDANMNIYELS